MKCKLLAKYYCMKMLNCYKKPDINDGITAFRKEKGAVLIDVRTADEYHAKHIEGSINIPVQSIADVYNLVQGFSTPLYVYCQSGVRSARAVQLLWGMGYSNVTDIGGFKDYNDG